MMAVMKHAMKVTTSSGRSQPRRPRRKPPATSRWSLGILLLGLLLAGPALAQEQPGGPPAALQAFLAPVSRHPGLQASAAALRVAEAQLAAARDPFSLSVSAGLSTFSYLDPPELPPGMPPETALPALGQLPDSASQVSADLTLRPWLFGDIRDLAEQRTVELELAVLDFEELLTTLEVQAVEAALNMRLAQDALELARQGEELARHALAATRTRFERGAANQRELRDAEAGATEAAGFVLNAEGGLRLARLALRNLTGSDEPPGQQDLQVSVPAGIPLSVKRARLRSELALVGANNARRSVLPVAQAGYTLHLDSENSVGVTVESRTLQPNLNYTHQKPGAAFPQDQLRGAFQIGVSASISPAVGSALRAADAQVEAAAAALQAEQQAAELQLAALRNDLLIADQELGLAELQLENARLTLDEARQREELGLGIPLQTQRAAIDHLQAGLDLQAARQELLARTLAFHSYYGTPLSYGGSAEVDK
jgi:outer membrane protein TolC